MDLGELGEIFGVLLFYLYPEREVESFITALPLCNLNVSICVVCLGQHSDACKEAQKEEMARLSVSIVLLATQR